MSRVIFQSHDHGHEEDPALAVAARRMSVGRANTRHGHSGSRLYMVWKGMRSRCTNKASKSYKDYGARGIAVCDEWQDYLSFFIWAKSAGYRPGLTIERDDVDQGYSPGNCRWIPRAEQSRNQRRIARSPSGTPWFEIAIQNGIGRQNYGARLHYGWTPERAATEPLNLSQRRDRTCAS